MSHKDNPEQPQVTPTQPCEVQRKASPPVQAPVKSDAIVHSNSKCTAVQKPQASNETPTKAPPHPQQTSVPPTPDAKQVVQQTRPERSQKLLSRSSSEQSSHRPCSGQHKPSALASTKLNKGITQKNEAYLVSRQKSEPGSASRPAVEREAKQRSLSESSSAAKEFSLPQVQVTSQKETDASKPCQARVSEPSQETGACQSFSDAPSDAAMQRRGSSASVPELQLDSKKRSVAQELADVGSKLELCVTSSSLNSVVCGSSDSDSHESSRGGGADMGSDGLRVQFARGAGDQKDTLSTASSSCLSLNQMPKSVSFHSGTSLPAERKICSAHDCLQFMITGSSLLKIRASSRQYRRYFTLEEDLSAVKWVPSSKKSNKARLSIRSIREIRMGKSTDVLRDKEVAGCYSEDCVFSIVYGDNFESLDLVATTPDEANFWVTGLNMLIAANRSPDNMDERQRMREKWLQEMFERADTERRGLLDEVETIALVQKLNSQLSTVRLKQKIMEFDMGKTEQDRGRIDRSQFVSLFKELATRPEIYFLMVRYSGKDYLTVEDLQFFLEGEQEFENVTVEDCLELIKRYEPSEEARKNSQMLLDGFTLFLLSEECSLMDQSHKEVFQSMDQPLAHYFISTSHNTYLLEDQLKGPSGVDGYAKALTQGCRVVKVDCWDSPCGPVVYHGNTLTSKVRLEDVLDTIHEYAFRFSEYPLIMHLENHCSPDSQRTVADLLNEKLGDLIYVPRRDGPNIGAQASPSSLMRKILIQGKKLPSTFDGDEAEASEEDDFVDSNSCSAAGSKKLKLCRALSDYISLARVHFTDFATSQQSQAEYEICSFSETSAMKLGHALADEVATHTKRFLTHVSPNASRVDSSNYSPLELWACGFQMVALNFQTSGTPMDLHRGWFQQNGGCGYILKPSCLRQPWAVFNAYRRETFADNEPLYLRVKIISGQQLPLPRGASSKATAIDPYVTVQVFGIPTDCAEARTKTVSNEGHSPIFDESFEFTMAAPELALLRFTVLDDEFIGDDFIGQHSIPVCCLKTGYRHIQLLGDTGNTLQNSTLFLHVTMSTRSGDKKLKRKRSWQARTQAEMRHIGIRQIDETCKVGSWALNECQRLRGALDRATLEACEECGLPSGANLAQCLRALVLRLAATPEVVSLHITEEKGFPVLKVQGELPLKASKVVTAFEKVLAECKLVSETSQSVLKTLKDLYATMKTYAEDLNTLCSAAGLKGKKAEKAAEHFIWNASIIEARMDMVQKVGQESLLYMKQVLRLGPTARRVFNRERDGSSWRFVATPSDHPSSHGGGVTLSVGGLSPAHPPPPPTPTSPGDTRIRGILKKTGNAPPPLTALDAAELSNGDSAAPSPSPRTREALAGDLSATSAL
ncbi:inactive phospholipase C-like protein 1 isoform X2 [Ornithodoros turicata]